MPVNSNGKTSPGTIMRSVPSAIWNNMVDAGQAFANQRISSSAPPPTRARATDLLKLRNSSGASRKKGEILKIDGKVIETVSEEFIWLDGKEPEPDCRFGILKEPALDEEVATAQVSGVCMALVNVTDADHTFAYPADGEYILQSGDSGPLEILFAPDGTGELDCVVRFASGTSLVRAQLNADLTAGDKVSATVRRWDESDESWSNGDEIQCRLATDIEMSNGDEGWAMSYGGVWWITPIACPEE